MQITSQDRNANYYCLIKKFKGMKKLVLLFAMSIMYHGMYASNAFRHMWKNMDEPVKITVRGIDFFIFPNGEFDFNAHQRHNNYYYAPGEYGVRVEKDRYGKIRRIGNVFVNYNRYGQVSRIGNVFIKYNFRGNVEEIGRMRLRYVRGRYYVIRHRHYPSYTWNWGWGNTYYGPAPSYSTSSYSYNSGNYYNDYDYNNFDEDDYNDNEDSGDYYYKHGKGKSNKKKTKVKTRRR